MHFVTLGAGDFQLKDLSLLPDPCPFPEKGGVKVRRYHCIRVVFLTFLYLVASCIVGVQTFMQVHVPPPPFKLTESNGESSFVNIAV